MNAPVVYAAAPGKKWSSAAGAGSRAAAGAKPTAERRRGPGIGEFELTCRRNLIGHICYDIEAATLTLRFYNPRKVARTTLQYAIEDYWGAVVGRGARPIDLGGQENLDLPFDLYRSRRGIYCATFRAGDGAESELVYSVLPPNPHLHEFYPAGD